MTQADRRREKSTAGADANLRRGRECYAHEAGVVSREPGLYFVGLPFLYSMSSSMVHGVGRDAQRIARLVAARAPLGAGAALSPAPDAPPLPSAAPR